jgi:hypothetical protein
MNLLLPSELRLVADLIIELAIDILTWHGWGAMSIIRQT